MYKYYQMERLAWNNIRTSVQPPST